MIEIFCFIFCIFCILSISWIIIRHFYREIIILNRNNYGSYKYVYFKHINCIFFDIIIVHSLLFDPVDLIEKYNKTTKLYLLPQQLIYKNNTYKEIYFFNDFEEEYTHNILNM